MAKNLLVFFTLKKHPRLIKIFFLILIVSALAIAGYSYRTKTSPLSLFSLRKEQETTILFLSEVYDKVRDNYWEDITDQDLVNLFKLASDKTTKNPQILKSTSKEGLREMVKSVTRNMDQREKKDYAINVASIVLANLKPFSRSVLYTVKQEQELKNLVQNINPEKDLYKDLGLSKNAPEEAVKQAYQTKEEGLKKDQSEEGKKKLAEVKYAKDVLTNEDSKKNYDSKGIEPTVFTKLISPNIFYIQLKKFSPTTFDEFQKAGNTYTGVDGPDALIFDLRGNTGGAIDVLPYFLGNFLGYNQYAFDFYQKGEYEPFKTPTDKLPGLVRFKQAVILVDNQTQSSAELMAASLKKYRFGIVVGVATKGWGTIEKVFPMDHQIDRSEKYSIFLVHHITIRDDGQPIEGRGVEPNVNIKDPRWESELYGYFRNPELTAAIREIWSTNQ